MNPGQFRKGDPRAAESGRKGGRLSGGNFKNDPARAVSEGRKGGLSPRRRIDTSDIPEADEDWFRRAEYRKPR